MAQQYTKDSKKIGTAWAPKRCSYFSQKSKMAGLTYKSSAQILFVRAIGDQSTLDSVHIANCISFTWNFSQQNKASEIVTMLWETRTKAAVFNGERKLACALDIANYQRICNHYITKVSYVFFLTVSYSKICHQIIEISLIRNFCQGLPLCSGVCIA